MSSVRPFRRFALRHSLCVLHLIALLPLAAATVTVNVPAGGSLTAARDAVRALPPDVRARGVEVVLAPGRYAAQGTLILEAQDGGTAAAPVVWRAAAGGRAILCDGVQLPAAAL